MMSGNRPCQTPFDRLRFSRRLDGTTTWASFGFAAMVATGLIYKFTPSRQVLLPFLPLAFGLVIAPLAVRLGATMVRGLEPTLRRFVTREPVPIDRWFKEHFDEFATARTPFWVGVGFVVVAVPTFAFGGSFTGISGIQTAILGIILGTSAFTAGVAIASVTYLARFIWRTGVYPVVVENHSFGVLGVGRLLFHVYLIGCAVWLVYLVSALGSIKDPMLPLLVLGAPSVVVLIGTFVGCQIPIHRQMLADKATRLEETYRLLHKIHPKTPEELSADRLEQIEKLRQIAEDLRQLPEWPFGWRVFTGVIGGAFGSISPSLLGVLADRLFPRG